MLCSGLNPFRRISDSTAYYNKTYSIQNNVCLKLKRKQNSNAYTSMSNCTYIEFIYIYLCIYWFVVYICTVKPILSLRCFIVYSFKYIVLSVWTYRLIVVSFYRFIVFFLCKKNIICFAVLSFFVLLFYRCKEYLEYVPFVLNNSNI